MAGLSERVDALAAKIVALAPDLVLTFSDLQADIAAELVRRGIDVMVSGNIPIAAGLSSSSALVVATAEAMIAVNQLDTGVLIIGTSRVEFPYGSKSIRFDARRGGLFWEAPPPASKPAGG